MQSLRFGFIALYSDLKNYFECMVSQKAEKTMMYPFFNSLKMKGEPLRLLVFRSLPFKGCRHSFKVLRTVQDSLVSFQAIKQ